MSIDRRRAPRVEILGRLHGHLVSLDLPVVVREISLGGLSLETAVLLPTGAVHEFRLMLGDESAVVLRGRVLHTRETVAPDGSRLYISGVKFLEDDTPEGPAGVGGLIDKIT